MRDPSGDLQKDRLKDFEYRIFVNSSRGFSDGKVFDENLRQYLTDLGVAGDDFKSKVCFVACDSYGGIWATLDAWCKKNGYEAIPFTPAWGDIDAEGSVIREKNGRQYNILAGHWCNEEMAEVANYLITFYDGVSTDTRDIITRMTDNYNPCRVILVHIEKDEKDRNHGRKSSGG